MSCLSAKDEGDAFDVTFSFSAGGWFQMYHCGVCQAIVDCGIIGKFAAEGKRIRFAGCSAGALAAACMASKCYRFKEIREFLIQCAEHYRGSWLNLFCMKQYLEESLDKFGAHLRDLERKPRTHEMLNDGSLEIFVTTLPNMKQKVLTEFHSYEDVVEALKASCCMAPLVGAPFRLRGTGEWVCDGAVATVIPHKDNPKTITVSPFYSSTATVHPTIFVPMWWGLRPPGKVAFRNLFSLGYNDMIEGLVMNGYLTPDEGESMLKPEVKFLPGGGVIVSCASHLLDFLVFLFVRPVVVCCIYAELAFMSGVYFLKGLVFLDSRPLARMCDNVRNMVSIRTLGRLIFGEVVPHNGERLEKSSRLYRLFNPIILGGKKNTERAVMSPTGVSNGKRPSLSPNTCKRARAAAKRTSQES
ncbi:patatin-like phospholipase [Trypanosoma rangeli]|uniref:Patatin-like phospholipase n=1 Tax=Trypanosoma rangeli TaxID=5698 RepID=A0A422N4J2_TRYRA|nr:patatin-like phospholipase [Trypanosoma rangeli]RNF00374.1 patatin-like phospholipase [Trypanosoma rangeli]|eukprot:RNF00374.1 patatin-like phospholipase [Trypanosoma rangeli]